MAGKTQTSEHSSRSNPVIKVVHGVKIRNRNKLAISYNARDYEKIVTGAYNAGISLCSFINMHMQPCSQCNSEVMIVPRARIPRKTQSDGQTTIFARNEKANGHE